jgi:hypothetical protein
MGQPCPQRGVGWRRTLLEEIRVKKGVLAESHLIKKIMDEGENSLIKPLVRESQPMSRNLILDSVLGA